MEEKENRKWKKKKEGKIYTEGPGATNRPSSRSGPWPRKPIRTGTQLRSLPRCHVGPSCHPSPPAVSSTPVTEPPHRLLPSSILINARPFRPRTMPIKSPLSPLFSPFRPSARDEPRTTEFVDGDPQVLRPCIDDSNACR
jgi:hypothetical protein